MIKILMISMSFPLPLRAGGKIRIFNLIKQLSLSCKITILSLVSEEERQYIPDLERYCSRVETVSIAEGVGNVWLHRLQSFPLMATGDPGEMALKQYDPFHRALGRLLSEESYDLVQVEFAQMLPYPFSNKGIKSDRLIWVAHEVLNRRLYKRSDSEKGIRRWFWQREARLTEAYEAAAARRLQYAIAVSDSEAHCLRSWNPDLNVAVVPNGVDVAYYDEVSVAKEPLSLIFTGWMRHFPNLDAAHYLLEDILPLILQKIPDARLYLVGDPIPQKLRDLASSIPQVVLTGYVNDIRPYIHRASIAIVPLRMGGGTHLKVLEAMATHTAVVMTSVGAEGLPVQHGMQAWIADDAGGLAEGVLQLLGDAGLRARMVLAAREMVERQFDWKAIAAIQRAFYESVLQGSWDRDKPTGTSSITETVSGTRHLQ